MQVNLRRKTLATSFLLNASYRQNNDKNFVKYFRRGGCLHIGAVIENMES
jgi:hypothetical protein